MRTIEQRTASMQTAEPLQRLPLSEGAEPVEQVGFYRSLVLDPPYQRGSVWGVVRQRSLIRSLLRGIPTGSVYLNTRPDADLTVAVVDGKQRIEAVRAFLTDELAVPASWFAPDLIEATEGTDDGPYVRWSGLSVVGRRRFQRARFTTLRTELATVDEEAELFEIVNYGGVPQGESDDD